MKPLRWFLRISAILGLTVSSIPVSASEKSSLWPDGLEKGKYQTTLASDGRVLWTVQWETRVTENKGRPQVEIQEQGEGQPFRYPQPIRWKKRMLFSAPEGAPLQVDLVEGQRWKQSGEPLSSMEVRLDREQGLIRYVDREGKKSESTVFPWTPLALPDELLFHWARTLPYETAARGEAAGAECLLLVSPKRRFHIDARVRGKENIRTPAGNFSCYRVDFSPRLAGPLKAFAPKISFWCRTDFPHVWVRYEGPAGGPGSPRVAIELVEFKTENPRT